MFVTDEQIAGLTGTTRPKQQIKRLREAGYKFMVRGDGRPVMLLSAMQAKKEDALRRRIKDDDGLLSLETILQRATQAKPICGVYFLISGGIVCYVGQSTNVLSRVMQHLYQDKKGFDAFHYIRVQKGRLSQVEKAYIKKFRPGHNKQGNQ